MANPEHLEILNQGVETWNKWRDIHDEIKPDLSDADLSGSDCRDANFTGANLGGANLNGANLIANFSWAYLSHANLSDANLRNAWLLGTTLKSARLSGSDLHGAWIGSTDFADVDLREVRGLTAVIHQGPSEISVSTLYRSEGQIPEAFLRGCGVPESFIVQIPALVAAMQPIQFYSCFISYSSKDQEFAEKLHADLQAKGVRLWFAPHDLPIGARIRPAIDESIRVHDKLLLVLSETSVSSQWVEQELETALARERELEGRTVLFPVRIDDAVMGSKAGWPALLRNTRNVGDFTRWKDHDSYRKAFDRLLRDLRAGA